MRLSATTMRAAAAAAVLCLGVSGVTAADKAPLKIGVPTDLSSTYADLGNQVIRAVEFAIEEANKSGGVDGRKVEYKSYDTEAKPDIARRQAEKLVLEGYPILLGLIASGEGLAIAPMQERWGSMYISTINKADALTGAECQPRVFRLNTQSEQDNLTIKPWLEKRKERKWAVVAVDIAWGRSSGEGFTKTVESVGGKVVTAQYTPSNTNDFAPFIQQVKDSGAEAVWIVLSGRDAINFAQQAKQFGLSDKVTMAGVSFTTDNAVKSLGDVSKGIYGIINYSASLDTPENKAFVAKWKAKYNTLPTNFEGETYIGMQILLQAVKAAGSTDPVEIGKAMAGKQFDTILGKLTVRKEDHQLMKPNYFGEVAMYQGELRPVITMQATAQQVAPPVTCKNPNM